MSQQDTKSWAQPTEKTRRATGTNCWFAPELLPAGLVSRRTLLETGSPGSTRLIQLKVLIIQTHLIGLVWKHQARE